MKGLLFPTISLAVTLAGCAASIQGQSAAPKVSNDETAVEVEAFQSLMKHYVSTGLPGKCAISLCVNDMPPSAMVIKMLALQRSMALPCGHASLVFPSGRLFVDGDSLKPAIQYELSHVFIEKQIAHVIARRYEGFGMSDSYEVVLSKSSGAWELAGMKWIGSE